MSSIKEELVEYGKKIYAAHLVVGTPQLLTPEQENDLTSLSGPQHRVKMMEKE